MTATERAERIWPILVLCASRRETLTYDVLSRLMSVTTPKLALSLEPIQAYCVLQSLPPLTAIVVERTTGLSRDEFFTAADMPRAQAEVYAYAGDWLRVEPPGAELLHNASRGIVIRRATTGQDIQFRPAEVKVLKERSAAVRQMRNETS